MDKVLSAHRAELSHGEEPREWNGADLGTHGARIVMRLGEQACSASVTGEDKRPGWALGMSAAVLL